MTDDSTTLLLGGRIHSPSNPDATAMAVKDGTIVWIGQDGPGRAVHPDARVEDLDGAFVAPGFVDAHAATSAARRSSTAGSTTPATGSRSTAAPSPTPP
ncbi:amidohydrolase, partial [Amycolatopsis sp. NPDC006125]